MTAVPGRVAVYLLVPVRAVPADGRSFPVTVIIDNATGHAVPTGTCPDAAAGLSSARVPFEPVYPAVGCTVTPTYPPGVTRLARSVSTAYQLCVGDGGEADATMPRCTGPAHSTMPPLPAGRYQVRFDTNGVPGAVEPDPVFVTLVRP